MKYIIYIILSLLVLIGIGFGLSKAPANAGQYDEFAQCVADSGATFYGAFWCGACNQQKALFGKSAKKLPYLECSTPDGRGQIQECIDVGIQSYPTWHFTGGEVISGVLSFDTLAAETGCELPQ